MAVYVYKCPKCDYVYEDIRSMSAVEPEIKCTNCGIIMLRDYAACLPNVGDRDYHRPIVSDSLAVSMNQIEEHRRLFPDIKILNDGRPVFDNYKKHDDYLKKTGFVKMPQKIKRQGTKIA